MLSLTRVLSVVIVALISGTATYWSARLLIADRLTHSEALEKRRMAASLVPANSNYWLNLAYLQQQLGKSAQAAFSTATTASPRGVNAWIGLGLEQEIDGDSWTAERTLLHAAAISREYVPRWTLTNFYFRRNDDVNMMKWARQALFLSSGDMEPVFRMCWTLSEDAGRIGRDAIPDRKAVLVQYLVWLTEQGRLNAAAQTSTRLLPLAGKEDTPAFLNYCERLLAAGDFPGAQKVWNQLIARHLLGGTPVTPGAGLQNGAFLEQPGGVGFEWRTPSLDGVTIRPIPPGLRIGFSGKQPESCQLLSQYVRLDPNRTYRLESGYQTGGVGEPSGLSWHVFASKPGTEFTTDSPDLGVEKTVRHSQAFVTSPETSGGMLALIYRRPPGRTRMQGWLLLKEVSLRPVD